MSEAEVVGSAVRVAVTRLYTRFRSERLDGEVPDAALLILLALDGGSGMSLTGLADHAKVTLGSVSQTVRRLEEQGLLTKARDTDDRRKVVFLLAPAGREAVSASRTHRRTWLNNHLAALPAEDLAVLRRAAAILRTIAES